VVWNVTLLNLGCCWRKQAAGRPTDRPLCPSYCCFQLKLNFAIGHGLALKEILSRAPETDRQTYTQSQTERTHHITAFRNNDDRLFCPAVGTTQGNQRPCGPTSSSTQPRSILRTGHNQNPNHRATYVPSVHHLQCSLH
jgi:hypothetical protein